MGNVRLYPGKQPQGQVVLPDFLRLSSSTPAQEVFGNVSLGESSDFIVPAKFQILRPTGLWGQLIQGVGTNQADLLFYVPGGSTDQKVVQFVQSVDSTFTIRGLTDVAGVSKNFLALKNDTGFVGVNTTSPAAQLHVSSLTLLTGNVAHFGTVPNLAGGVITPLSIGRTESTASQVLNIHVDDNYARFESVQDEAVAGYVFRSRTETSPVDRFHLTLYTDANNARAGLSAGGTVFVPSRGMFAISGSTSNVFGPHIEYFAGQDGHPVFQQLNWSHDDIELWFDGYYNGSSISSDIGSNFLFIKINDALSFWGASGVSPGNVIGWTQDLLVVSSSLRIGIGAKPRFSTDIFQVSGTAGKTAGGTTWASISDQKYKTNIITISGALDKLTNLRGVTFEWVDNRVSGTQHGLIAQEVEPIIPQWVNTAPDGDKWFNPVGVAGVLVEAFE